MLPFFPTFLLPSDANRACFHFPISTVGDDPRRRQKMRATRKWGQLTKLKTSEIYQFVAQIVALFFRLRKWFLEGGNFVLHLLKLQERVDTSWVQTRRFYCHSAGIYVLQENALCTSSFFLFHSTFCQSTSKVCHTSIVTVPFFSFISLSPCCMAFHSRWGRQFSDKVSGRKFELEVKDCLRYLNQ